jgi:predicted ferric reductase
VSAAIGPRGLLAAIGAGAAAALVLWWHSTPAITGPGGWLTGAGEILGLLAGYGVVVLVLLMARIPPIERGIGADRLARWHAMGGRYVIGLVTGHALAIIWGYAVNARIGPVSETATLLTTYPDVLMATVAWFLLLGVALVCARAVRRRLRYETWYYLHFYTYLSVALAFSHQFANGAAFTTDVAARFWWTSLYLVVAALVLWYRIVVPVRDFARHGLRVAGLRQEAPHMVSVYIKGSRLRELNAEPGQFFRWRFLARGHWWQSHPFSLSAIPSDDLMRITVRDLGDHSAALSGLKPGTRVIAEGPFGSFTLGTTGTLGTPGSTGRNTLLLAGGAGITPLRAMFAALSGEVTLIYRASSWQDIVFRAELDAIAQARDATVHYVVGTRSDLGTDPLSAATLRQLAPGLHRMDVYLCGPPGMTGAAVSALTEAGVPRRRIHHESFEFQERP